MFVPRSGMYRHLCHVKLSTILHKYICVLSFDDVFPVVDGIRKKMMHEVAREDNR